MNNKFNGRNTMKKSKKMLWPLTLLVLLIFALTACTKEQPSLNEKAQAAPAQAAPAQQAASAKPVQQEGKKVTKDTKIALISEFTSGTHAAQYITGVTKAAKKAGVQLSVSDSNNDQSKMAAYLDTAINQNVDGIMIDHGRAETLEPGVKRAIAKGIPVIATDVELKVEGVTTIDQDDYMLALQGLKQMMQDINGKGNIVYAFVGGFAPMEKRDSIYKIMMNRYPDVKQIATFGSATDNTSLDTQNKMAAVLKQYPNKGDIAAVWAPWDEFAKGVTRAIKEAGRDEIKVYGVDLSDEDLQMMQAKNSPWKASAAVNPASVGEKQVDLLLKKVSGQEIPRYYSFDPVLVKQTDLPNQTINMDQLSQYVEEWGKKE